MIPCALFRKVEGCYREIDCEFDFNLLQPLACFLAGIKCYYSTLSASAGGGGGGNVCFVKSIKSPSLTALLGTSFQERNVFSASKSLAEAHNRLAVVDGHGSAQGLLRRISLVCIFVGPRHVPLRCRLIFSQMCTGCVVYSLSEPVCLQLG